MGIQQTARPQRQHDLASKCWLQEFRSTVLYCRCLASSLGEGVIWEFPEIRDTLFRGPCNKDPTTKGPRVLY